MNSIIVKIREIYNDLNTTEQKIASYILDNPDDILHASIANIVERAGTSQAAVVRFCKTLGYNGFKDIKRSLTEEILAMARGDENKEESYSDIKGSESTIALIEKVTTNNIKSIEDTRRLMDFSAIEQAMDAIIKSGRVDFYGVGASGLVALDAQQKFSRIGRNCNASVDPHVQITLAANLKPGDVAVMISYSGMTRDIIDTLTVAKESGATIIAVCKYGKSRLASKADIVLHTCSPEITVRSGAMGSRIAQLTIIDMLFTGVAGHNVKGLQKALNRSYKYTAIKKLH